MNEQRAEWAPAIPIAFLTFLVGIFLWPLVALVAIAASATVVVRARRRQWTALTFAALGSVAGALLLVLFFVLTNATGGLLS